MKSRTTSTGLRARRRYPDFDDEPTVAGFAVVRGDEVIRIEAPPESDATLMMSTPSSSVVVLEEPSISEVSWTAPPDPPEPSNPRPSAPATPRSPGATPSPSEAPPSPRKKLRRQVGEVGEVGEVGTRRSQTTDPGRKRSSRSSSSEARRSSSSATSALPVARLRQLALGLATVVALGWTALTWLQPSPPKAAASSPRNQENERQKLGRPAKPEGSLSKGLGLTGGDSPAAPGALATTSTAGVRSEATPRSIAPLPAEQRPDIKSLSRAGTDAPPASPEVTPEAAAEALFQGKVREAAALYRSLERTDPSVTAYSSIRVILERRLRSSATASARDALPRPPSPTEPHP